MKNRLSEIYSSACDLFINKGYSRTQVKDIAGDIGLSTGMMYVYFTSKQDILNFVLKATIEPELLERKLKLPLSSDMFNNIENEVKETFYKQESIFANVLHGKRGDSFKTVLSSAFDIISKYGKGILIIEKNPEDVGGILDHYKEYRKRFYLQMLEYVKLFQKRGVCRELPYTEYSAQLIIETLSWWGMHVMNDAYTAQHDIDVDVAKEVCLDNLLHAYKS